MQAMMDQTQATTSMNTLTPLEELEERIKELRMQKKEILRAREQAQAKVTKLIDRNLVIAFVEELEKAHQYFDFKEYLKKNPDIKVDSSVESIYLTLAESQVRKERFEKVKDEAIRIAINAHISEIKDDQRVKSRYDYTNWLISCKSITSGSELAQDMETLHSVDNHFPGLSFDEKKWELNKYKLFLSLWVYFKEDKDEMFREKFKKEYDRALAKLAEGNDYYAAVYLIYNLVFKARQAKHVMDENPEREIQQILESQPSTYFILVELFKEMMLSGHTRVLIREISCGASEDDVRRVFSGCGEIECVEFKRVKKGNVAFVTYKEPQGAHRACLLKSRKVCNRDVWVVRVFNHSPPSVDDDEPTLENVEKFVSSMHDKALDKYRHLRSADTKGILTGSLDKEKETEPQNKPRVSRKRKMVGF